MQRSICYHDAHIAKKSLSPARLHTVLLYSRVYYSIIIWYCSALLLYSMCGGNVLVASTNCTCSKYIYHSKTSRGADCLLLCTQYHSKTSRGADCLLLLYSTSQKYPEVRTALASVHYHSKTSRGADCLLLLYSTTRKYPEALTACYCTVPLKNIPRRGLLATTV